MIRVNTPDRCSDAFDVGVGHQFYEIVGFDSNPWVFLLPVIRRLSCMRMTINFNL